MTVDDLIGLETQVWQALVDGDGDADARLLADDFLGVYPAGFAGRGDHVQQLAAGPTVTRFELADPHMVVLSESALLLSYRAVYERVGHGQGAESMYVSSVWCRRGDRWVNVFSQDTPDNGIAVV